MYGHFFQIYDSSVDFICQFLLKEMLSVAVTHTCVRDKHKVERTFYGLGPDLYLNVDIFWFIQDLLFIFDMK